MLHAIGDNRVVQWPMKLRSTLVTGDTNPHRDVKINENGFETDEDVILINLNDNEGAYFKIGDDMIPAVAGSREIPCFTTRSCRAEPRFAY